MEEEAGGRFRKRMGRALGRSCAGGSGGEESRGPGRGSGSAPPVAYMPRSL